MYYYIYTTHIIYYIRWIQSSKCNYDAIFKIYGEYRILIVDSLTKNGMFRYSIRTQNGWEALFPLNHPIKNTLLSGRSLKNRLKDEIIIVNVKSRTLSNSQAYLNIMKLDRFQG